MKILQVELQYDYGMKHRGKNMIGQIGFKQAFEKLGHEVVCFYYDDYLQNPENLQKDLIKFADEQKPDLVYFQLFGDQFTFETLDYLKSKYRTINWFGDDQWRFESFTKKYAPHFTYSITTDHFAVMKYKSIGIDNVFVSQWAALDLDVQIPEKTEYKYDISFVGGSHSVRRWFIKHMKKHGLNVHAFGFGWPGGAIPLERIVEIFQTSKINLNLSNSINYDLRYLTDNIKNPVVAWKYPKAASQVKARNFEIPFYGGFQLTDYVPSLEHYFKIGQEVACYTNVDEAILLAKYYLENEQERENIKFQSIDAARQRHSYLSRHKEILSRIL